jgi:pyruvate/2-oxoglutarate dehydrogenase complex dihydrolipoamide acyltransferase (E2) component
MPTEVIAPRLGVTVTEVRIVEWLVADGAHVAEGDPLAAVATDKAEIEIYAPATGVLQHIAAVDDECAVGMPIGAIVETPQDD